MKAKTGAHPRGPAAEEPEAYPARRQERHPRQDSPRKKETLVSTTTETLKHGTELVAEKTADAAAEIAERAKKQAESLLQAAERLPGRKAKPRHRGRKVLGTLLAVGAAAMAAMKGRRAMQRRREQQEIIDLTLGQPSADGQTASAPSRVTTTP